MSELNTMIKDLELWYFCCDCTEVHRRKADYTCPSCGGTEIVLIENQNQMKDEDQE